MKQIHIPSNFIYPKIPETAYRFGSGQLTGKELRPDGDWRDYLPPEEDQNQRGVESSACYVEASQHSLATIQEEEFNLPNKNYSARFNALLSNGSVLGGDPLEGGQSIRHDGLIPDNLMPFGEHTQSWDDFHSWKNVEQKKCKDEGKNWLQKWQPNYDIGFTKEELVMSKYIKLKQILKYSPPPVSVTAWYEENGIYVKPAGSQDNHLVELVYIDEQNRPHIRDTYPPYEKILEPYYNFDFCMRWSLKNLSTPPLKKNWLWDLIIRLLNIFK